MTEISGAGAPTADAQTSGGVVDTFGTAHILQPWLGTICVIVVAMVIVWPWRRRTRYLPWYHQLVIPAVAAVSAMTFWLAMGVIWHPVADGIGWFVWTQVDVVDLITAQLVTGNRTEGRHRAVRLRNRHLARATESASSLMAVMVSSLLIIDTFFASYPTLVSVLGYGVATTPFNRLQDVATRSPAPVRGHGMLEETWRPPPDIPAHGQVVTADILAGDQPGTKGSTPRGAFIYLPLACLGSQHPALPALVLLTGQLGSPLDRLELGNLKGTMGICAADHHGLVPITAATDPLDSPCTNPLCSDTEAGDKVAICLEKDIPAWIRASLQVDDDPVHQAMAGLFNGGAYAMQVVTRSPGVCRTFLTISVGEHPMLDGKERTVSRGFGGGRAAYQANDPLSLMPTVSPGRYDGITGILSVDRQDTNYHGVVPVLTEVVTRAGMAVSICQYDGAHTWVVWGSALVDQLDWPGGCLGITSSSSAS